MKISEIIKHELVDLDMQAGTQEEVFRHLSKMLEDNGKLSDRHAFIDDVVAREKVSSTGIGNGVAIPHGKSDSVKETSIAIGRSKAPLEWETFDDKPVRLVVLLAVNENDKGGVHVKLLSQIARKLASAETCQSLLDASTIDEIIKILSD